MSNSLDKEGHGLFTYYLLKGLSGYADADKNNALTVGELYYYIKTNVYAQSRRIGTECEQTPEIMPSLEKRSNWVLFKTKGVKK